MTGGRIEGNEAPFGGGVAIRPNGVFEMSGGLIADNEAEDGGGVSVWQGEFDMQGGTIQNNDADAFGGGVAVWTGGVFEMSDGLIAGNEANDGGGVFAWQGDLTMYDGLITDNDAASFGGGVFALDSDFVMWDGEISDNLAAADGGGIYLWAADFTMHDGRIIDNDAEALGGGLAVLSSTFLMWDGIISGNTAYWDGGGIRLHLSDFTMHDGLIADNAAQIGAGVTVSSSDFVMWDGTISGNDASLGGGGVRVHLSDFIMHDGLITGNEAGVRGGGVEVFDGGSAFIMHDGEISANTAGDNGGGIFAEDYASLTISDTVVFSGNTASALHDFFQHPAFTPGGTVPAADSGGGSGGSTANIEWASVSIADTHALNNFDINYTGHELFLVTFRLNGGNVGGATANVVHVFNDGDEIGAANVPVPVHANHDFDGWLEVDANGLAIGLGLLTAEQVAALIVEGSRTFVAQWTQVGGGNGGGGGGGVVPPPPPPPPSDTPERHAFLIGRPDGTIRPTDNITRAEVATIFFRLVSDETRTDNWTQENPFSDVIICNWFNNAVSTTTGMGLFQGVGDGSFAPQRTITRGELAAVMARFIGADTGLFSVGDDQFNDIAGHWARAYINTVAELGWVQGPQGIGGPFHPNQPITRADTAAMVNRMFGRLVYSTDYLLYDMVTWPDNMRENAWYYLYMQSATNSFTYELRAEGQSYLNWLEIIEPRNWRVLERPYSEPGDILR